MLKPAAVLLLLIAPWFFSIATLRMIDRAARENQCPVKYVLVDLFSLIFMIQIPYAILSHIYDAESNWMVVATVLAGLMVLIWNVTITAVSRAGITATSARAWISLLVIPITYVGNFLFCGLAIALTERRSNVYQDRQLFWSAVFAEFVLSGLMILAYFKTRQIVRDASIPLKADQPTQPSSPFED